MRELQREASFHVNGLVTANEWIAFFVDWAVISGDLQNVWLLVLFILEMEATQGEECRYKPLSVLISLRLNHQLDLSFEEKQQVEVRVAVGENHALQRRQWH